MINIYTLNDANAWDEIVKSYDNHDVYYLSGYNKAFKINGDGEPVLIEWESGSGLSAICVLMLRNIAEDLRFANKIDAQGWLDATTPYGYGGFIFNNPIIQSEEVANLKRELLEWGSANNIISIVMRLHPVLGNAIDAETFMDVRTLGNTITMDLESEEVINANLSSKNRNMIRKAQKSGVQIFHSKATPALMRDFKAIYEETMRRDEAAGYYYFDQDFYDSIMNDLSDNHEIFYAVYDEKIISMAIMIYSGQCLNYHLSGSLAEYRTLAAGNLLLNEAARWGAKNGFKTFHLGGGVGAGEDSLYKFKSAFNRNSDTQFALGSIIIDPERYEHLVKLRSEETSFNSDSKFFPLYRS